MAVTYPSDMSYKGLVDWAVGNDNTVNAATLSGKSVDTIQSEVMDAIVPMDNADLAEACPELFN